MNIHLICTRAKCTLIQLYMYMHILLTTYRSPSQSPLYLIKRIDRAPALGYEAALGHIKVEHVHDVVDGLDLLHLL